MCTLHSDRWDREHGLLRSGPPSLQSFPRDAHHCRAGLAKLAIRGSVFNEGGKQLFGHSSINVASLASRQPPCSPCGPGSAAALLLFLSCCWLTSAPPAPATGQGESSPCPPSWRCSGAHVHSSGGRLQSHCRTPQSPGV